LRTQLLRLRSGKASSFPDRVRSQCTPPTHVERTLVALEALSLQIKEADKEVAALAKNDETCRLLMSAPGVGPVTAVRFLAIIDEPKRFRNAHAVQSYLGLTPGEHSSSERQHRTGITKAGSSNMRRTLVQAAWVAYRRKPSDPMIVWASKVAERRGIFVAIVALARKLAGVLYAMWRDGAQYRARSLPTLPSN
jgi:transposase